MCMSAQSSPPSEWTDLGKSYSKPCNKNMPICQFLKKDVVIMDGVGFVFWGPLLFDGELAMKLPLRRLLLPYHTRIEKNEAKNTTKPIENSKLSSHPVCLVCWYNQNSS